MQLIVDIENKDLVDKIIKILEVFKSDGVKVKAVSNNKENLPEFDIEYENSMQYKLDRAEFEEMKEKLWIIY